MREAVSALVEAVLYPCQVPSLSSMLCESDVNPHHDRNHDAVMFCERYMLGPCRFEASHFPLFLSGWVSSSSQRDSFPDPFQRTDGWNDRHDFVSLTLTPATQQHIGFWLCRRWYRKCPASPGAPRSPFCPGAPVGPGRVLASPGSPLSPAGPGKPGSPWMSVPVAGLTQWWRQCLQPCS